MQQVSEEFMETVRASRLPFGPGHPLWTYWTVGEGFAQWSVSPTPWTTLHGLLLKYVGPQAAGETTNVMLATPAGKALFEAHHGATEGHRAVTMANNTGTVFPREATVTMDQGNITAPDAADLNTAARKYCADQGWAMPDGSYPVRPANNHGATDLDKAVHAVGRGNASSSAIRKHVTARAHAIGQAQRIPDTWTTDSTPGVRSLEDGRRHYRAGISDLELKPGGDGRTIVGYAVPFDQPQRIDANLVEAFAPHSIDHQVRALHRVGYWNLHSVHGGVEVGHIKYARAEAAGLYTESFIAPDDPDGDRTLDEIRSGARPEQSVGFDQGPGGSVVRPDGVTYRTKVNLFELAAVPEGAYGSGASVTGVRSSACPECGYGDHSHRNDAIALERLAQARLIVARMEIAR
ncbi:MAG TPA: HK97 family phage prohead protease [Pseudonocardiaceae bacterium]|jgi:phage head maturation protease